MVCSPDINTSGTGVGSTVEVSASRKTGDDEHLITSIS